MAERDKKPVTMEELLVSSLAQTDALAKLLIEKGSLHSKRSESALSSSTDERGRARTAKSKRLCLAPSKHGRHRVSAEFITGHLPLGCTRPSFFENAASGCAVVFFPSTAAIPAARIRH